MAQADRQQKNWKMEKTSPVSLFLTGKAGVCLCQTADILYVSPVRLLLRQGM